MINNYIGDVSSYSYYSWFGQSNSYNNMSVKGLNFIVKNLAPDTRVFRVPYGSNTRTDLTVKININSDSKFYVANYHALFSDGTNVVYNDPSNNIIGEDTTVTLRGSSQNSLYYSSGITTPIGINTENNILKYEISFDSFTV